MVVEGRVLARGLEQRTMKPNAVDLAWAAGFFEGEGCTSLDFQKKGTRRRLSAVSTDLDVLNKLCRILGCGKVYKRGPGQPGKTRPRKQQWYWAVSNWEDVQLVATWLLPHMCSRRSAKLRLLLSNPPVRGSGFCKKGHPLVGPAADVYRNSLGHISCGPCSRERERNKRLLRKAAA